MGIRSPTAPLTRSPTRFPIFHGDCQYTIADTIAPKTKKIRKDNRSGCKIIVNNSPEPECEIGEDVNSGNDFPHRQGGNRRQCMVK